MESFIKKIFTGKIDEEVHKQFVRFGKGNYPGRAALSLRKSEKIKFGGSFEFANDFSILCSEFNCTFSGIILIKEEIPGLQGRMKSGLQEYIVEKLGSEKIKEIASKAYSMLLDAEGPGIILKMKKKLPKPGKSGEAKVDDKFCQIECDLKFLQSIREAFFWDIPDCKKANIKHTYEITEIVMPKGEKDFEKIRLLSKRKGKIIRKITIDGNENAVEKEFEA